MAFFGGLYLSEVRRYVSARLEILVHTCRPKEGSIGWIVSLMTQDSESRGMILRRDDSAANKCQGNTTLAVCR